LRWNRIIQRKLKADADAKKDEADEEGDEDDYQPSPISGDDSEQSSPPPTKKRKPKQQGGGKQKKPRTAKEPPKKKAKEKNPKDSGSESNNDSNNEGDDSDDSDGGKLSYKERQSVSKDVEKGNVQRALKKLRTSERDKNEMALSDSFARCERAKLGTFTEFDWMQMVANNVQAQRGEVVATVKGIVKKCYIHPNAMVSCMYILCTHSHCT
jgi:hypothetical protein